MPPLDSFFRIGDRLYEVSVEGRVGYNVWTLHVGYPVSISWEVAVPKALSIPRRSLILTGIHYLGLEMEYIR